MLKSEFETLIGKEVTDEEYEFVNYVYMNHPAISDKHQICDIYNAGGLRVIADMCRTANEARAIDRKNCISFSRNQKTFKTS